MQLREALQVQGHLGLARAPRVWPGCQPCLRTVQLPDQSSQQPPASFAQRAQAQRPIWEDRYQTPMMVWNTARLEKAKRSTCCNHTGWRHPVKKHQSELLLFFISDDYSRLIYCLVKLFYSVWFKLFLATIKGLCQRPSFPFF